MNALFVNRPEALALTFINTYHRQTLTNSFIHPFIHSRDLYSASSRHYNSEALPTQSRTKKKDFGEMKTLEGWATRIERNSKGRSFYADGPTTEKALHCIA